MPPGVGMAAKGMRFVDADVSQVLALYEQLSGRTLIRSPLVPMTTKITFENATPLTRVEALQALDTVLAANGIVMVAFGTKYVKVLTPKELMGEPGPVVELPADQLPDSSSYVVYVVKLRKLTPSDAVSILSPFSKLPNSIVGMKNSDLLILRDYSSNVRRMVQVLEEAESGVKSESPVTRLIHSLGVTNAPSGRRAN